MFSIRKIAEILLVLISLFIIIAVIFGYGTQLKGSIEKFLGKFLGFETEEEKIHNQNIRAQEEFKNLINHIEACKNSKDNNCGCDFNVKTFNKDQMILSRTVSLEVIDITNTEKNEIRKKVSFGIPLEKSDIKNTNCYFDEKFEKKEVDVARIFFDKEKPYLYTTSKFLFIPWGGTITLSTEYPLYKDSKENICWLSEKVKNIKECQ